MIADLLQLAISGQSMELYASFQQQQAQQQQQQQRLKQTTNHNRPANQLNLRSIELIASYQQRHQQQQAKPLDLSVSRSVIAPSAHSQAPTSASDNNNNDMPRVAAHLNQQLPPLELIAGAEARIKLEFDSFLARQHPINGGIKQLISSSTSPSSCSHSAASSVSSVELISSTNLNLSRRRASQQQQCAANFSSHQQPYKTTDSTIDATDRARNHLNLNPDHNLSHRRHHHHQAQKKQKGAKSHLCNQCGRCFSRSDMLTRHSRLHSGLKPYQCAKCKQVFSRSDHLSTHERTHTGEKPYQCEFCAYSACRRDMITRHMRTHTGSAGSQRTKKDKAGKQTGDHDRSITSIDTLTPSNNSTIMTNCDLNRDEDEIRSSSVSTSTSLSGDAEFE